MVLMNSSQCHSPAEIVAQGRPSRGAIFFAIHGITLSSCAIAVRAASAHSSDLSVSM